MPDIYSMSISMRRTSLILFFVLTSMLIFGSCRQENIPEPSNNSTGSLWDFKTLGGSTWVFTAYHDTVMTSNVPANDTLVFIDSTHYTWNGTPCTYEYYFYENSQLVHLNLYNTPFGDIYSHVPPNFETYGELNAIRFSSMTGVYYMWFERL